MAQQWSPWQHTGLSRDLGSPWRLSSPTFHFTDKETEAGGERMQRLHGCHRWVAGGMEVEVGPMPFPRPLPQHHLGQMCKVPVPEPLLKATELEFRGVRD